MLKLILQPFAFCFILPPYHILNSCCDQQLEDKFLDHNSQRVYPWKIGINRWRGSPFGAFYQILSMFDNITRTLFFYYAKIATVMVSLGGSVYTPTNKYNSLERNNSMLLTFLSCNKPFFIHNFTSVNLRNEYWERLIFHFFFLFKQMKYSDYSLVLTPLPRWAIVH